MIEPAPPTPPVRIDSKAFADELKAIRDDGLAIMRRLSQLRDQLVDDFASERDADVAWLAEGLWITVSNFERERREFLMAGPEIVWLRRQRRSHFEEATR